MPEKPLPDLPDVVWQDVLETAELAGRDPIELLVEAWREYVRERQREAEAAHYGEVCEAVDFGYPYGGEDA